VTTGRLAAPKPEPAPAKLVVVAQDGSPGREYPLTAAQTDIGRSEGAILLPNDPYVSPRHARLTRQGERFSIRDLGSLNGVFVRLNAPTKLQHGDLVLIGLEVLRFEVVTDADRGLGPASDGDTQVFGSPMLPRYARLCQRTVEGVTRDVYYVSKDEVVIGREAGDIVFTGDPFMSRRHATIGRDPDGSYVVRDLGSSNGTYVAIHEEHALSHGDHVRVGQHLFRLEVSRGRGS
jgi:pSer/pThr/pTyr-binding forkhead associated (FHA) protein